jgi:hypothetical protein
LDILVARGAQPFGQASYVFVPSTELLSRECRCEDGEGCADASRRDARLMYVLNVVGSANAVDVCQQCLGLLAQMAARKKLKTCIATHRQMLPICRRT